MKKKLHTPEGVRDIYQRRMRKKTGVGKQTEKEYFIYMDIMISRLRRLNILMCSARRLEPYRPSDYINFLTKMATHWS